MNNKCKTIYEGKLKVMNMINERVKNDKRIYELVEDHNEFLSDLNVYISNLMNYFLRAAKSCNSCY